MDILGLNGRAALVVGGGQGIGEAIALTLARCGCEVAVVDIVAGRAEAVAARVRELGVKATPVIHDGTAGEDHSGLLAQALAAHPQLDRLATIVGGAEWSPLLDMPLDMWN